MNEPRTLLLSETGVELLPDGSTAVNVGPIVRALQFLTEGRGEDRGTDEAGQPLPDLMSLAFDVIEAIIMGGRKADYFRQVKRELEAQSGASRSSLSLAKHARRVHAPSAGTALERAADSLQILLGDLAGRPLSPEGAQELKLALDSFRAFGADRWISASAQLLVAVSALGPLRGSAPSAPRALAKRKASKRRAKAPPQLRSKPKPSSKQKPVVKRVAAKRAPTKKSKPKPVTPAKRRR